MAWLHRRCILLVITVHRDAVEIYGWYSTRGQYRWCSTWFLICCVCARGDVHGMALALGIQSFDACCHGIGYPIRTIFIRKTGTPVNREDIELIRSMSFFMIRDPLTELNLVLLECHDVFGT